MIVYIQCFFASLLLFAIVPKIKREQQVIIIAFALVIPCFLAAIRDNSIGTDVMVFLRPIYTAAEQATNFKNYLNTSWFHIYKYNTVSDYEFGFVLVVYTVTKVFHSISSVKFAIEFLILCPIYLALKRYCKEIPTWMGMAVFYFLFYNQTFNLMRQYIAIAFLFLGIMGYLRKDSVKHYLTFQIIALLFHSSSIAGIPIFLIARYIKDPNMQCTDDSLQNKKGRCVDKGAKILFLTAVGVGVLLAFGIISKVLTLMGLGRYIGYVAGELSFMPNQVLIRLPIILLCVLGWRKLTYEYSSTSFLMTMIIYTVIFSQFAGSSTFGARIAVYFAIFQVVLIPQIMFSNVFGSRIDICQPLLFGYLVFYWCYFYGILGMDATLPFLIAR